MTPLILPLPSPISSVSSGKSGSITSLGNQSTVQLLQPFPAPNNSITQKKLTFLHLCEYNLCHVSFISMMLSFILVRVLLHMT